MGVVAGGDGLHCVGEGFHWAGDLLAEIEREPAAGEERQRGGEEKEAHVETANFSSLAVEHPVFVSGLAQAKRGGGDSGRDGNAGDDEVAVGKAGGGEGVVGAGEGVEGLVGSLSGLRELPVRWGLQGRSRGRRVAGRSCRRWRVRSGWMERSSDLPEGDWGTWSEAMA